ncbi:MAG: heavy-metal-associated domain-containing protein [Anditalea sp.]
MMMKKGILLAAMLLGTFAFNPANAQNNATIQTEVAQAAESATFYVDGKCGMCKNRIENAVKDLKGIEAVNWDVETKALTVKYNASKVKEAEIHQKIADVGHDTEKLKASDEAYSSLPGCCKYERKEA